VSAEDWREALRETCGELVVASLHFAPAPFPRGPEGVRALAARLLAHLDDEHAGDPEDRAFVEGAGALLGLLLVEHAGSGALVVREGRARVRLGERGFVDPFTILEGCLDADRPRDALRDAIARAEAEARGEGPFSRVLTAIEEVLVETRPDLRVAERFEAWLRLTDGTELALRRLVDATQNQPAPAVRAAARKFVAMIPGGSSTRTTTSDEDAWEAIRIRVLPRLVPAGFDAGEGAPTLLLAALPERDLRSPMGALAVAFIVPETGRARYVRADEPALHGREPASVLAQAIANLAARSQAARFARVETEAGPLVVGRTGDGLDAARLLLPGLHSVLAAELGPDCAVAVPHRDTLLACSAASPTAVAALAARARDDAARAPHRISDAVFSLDAAGLAQLSPRTGDGG
jgi:hypothetical protein